MTSKKPITSFEAKTYAQNNCIALIVPKPCADYIQVIAGDKVEVRMRKR
jgi:hypothetical protein